MQGRVSGHEKYKNDYVKTKQFPPLPPVKEQKKAIVTLVMGLEYQAIAKLTHPTLKAYAKKIGADFHVITEKKLKTNIPIGYEKLQLANYLDDYHRIIFIDTDIIIREDTPDLFSFVPEGWFGVFNEGEWIPERIKSLENSCKELGISAPHFKSQYYNTGVMVFEQRHADVFIEPPKYIDHFYEQSYLNIMLARNLCKVRNLSSSFNRMSFMDEKKLTKDHYLESYIVHYAGQLKQLGVEALCKQIKNDLDSWKTFKANKYHLPKVIKISVSGGLGDQIATEPVVREICRLYPHDKIYVASHWPEVFEDLPYAKGRVFPLDIRKHFIKEDIYEVFNTYSPPEDLAWKYMTHVFSHSTDFSSNLAIRRILPPEKKTIVLGYTKSQLQNMCDKLNRSKGWFSDAFLIHPGRSWMTKTLPKTFWEDIINELLKQNKKVVVFGKDGKDLQGLVDIDFDTTSVVDARNLLTLKESLALLDHSFALISNDSAPIHLAGATDIWIVGIYTAKHPAFVIPYRNGTQQYKTIQAQKEPSCWPCNINAVTTCNDEVRADFCLNLENKFCCFPSAQDVLKQIQKHF
jgi:ADP-heptose:LPS heptosyltransferase/lipopolysaccharide biosynthesis glycosyltransferase